MLPGAGGLVRDQEPAPGEGEDVFPVADRLGDAAGVEHAIGDHLAPVAAQRGAHDLEVLGAGDGCVSAGRGACGRGACGGRSRPRPGDHRDAGGRPD